MRFVLFFLLVFKVIEAHSQAYLNRDSLWQALQHASRDSNHVTLYIQLGQQYENNSPDSALWLYEQALKLSEQLNYTRGIISYYTNATYVYNAMSRYDTSLLLNLRSVEIATAFGDPERLGACLSNTGASFMALKRYERAIAYFLQAIQIYEKLNDLNTLSIIYRNLAVVYRETRHLDKAKHFAEQSLVIARKSGNEHAIIPSLINLSNVFTSLGQFKNSIALLEEARILSKRTANVYSVLVTALNLNDIYTKTTAFDKAKGYADEALVLATELDDRESVAIALRGLANYYFNKGQAAKAEEYATRSLAQALKYGFTEDIMKGYAMLAEIAILNREFEKNILYALKSDSIGNFLFNESVARNMQELEIKYESERKERHIHELQQAAEIKDLTIRQSRLFNYILIGSLVALAIIALLARRTYQHRKKLFEQESQVQMAQISKLKSEKQLLASEAVIKGQEEERGRIAKDLHDGLGGLLSGVKFSLANMKSNVILDADSQLVFERSLDMLDHSISELRRVAHNMMPEVLVKFGLTEALKSYCDNLRESQIFKIDFQSIGTDTRLEGKKEIFIFRIVQELLNNAARHAKATHVLVQVTHQANELTITVEDNGTGFDLEKHQREAGAGWINIRSRVEYLKGKLDVQSSAGLGTSVHIIIPVV
ncbi:MAG: sensor histidine kinase [Cytophagales bacterium]|nr:sensor histidine kinase [Cytophagales bacterium]